MRKNIKKWILTCSTDAIEINFQTVLFSETEPDFWTCEAIAAANNCEWFFVEEWTN